MATTTRPQPLSERTTSTTSDNNALERIQFTYEKNKKIINGVLTAALLIGAAVFAYFRLYLAPRETKAAAVADAVKFNATVNTMAVGVRDKSDEGFLKDVSTSGIALFPSEAELSDAFADARGTVS